MLKNGLSPTIWGHFKIFGTPIKDTAHMRHRGGIQCFQKIHSLDSLQSATNDLI